MDSFILVTTENLVMEKDTGAVGLLSAPLRRNIWELLQQYLIQFVEILMLERVLHFITYNQSKVARLFARSFDNEYYRGYA